MTYTAKETGDEGVGLIAEDLDALGLDRLVIYDEQGRPDAVRYETLSLYLLEIVKDLKAQNEDLEQRLEKAGL